MPPNLLMHIASRQIAEIMKETSSNFGDAYQLYKAETEQEGTAMAKYDWNAVKSDLQDLTDSKVSSMKDAPPKESKGLIARIRGKFNQNQTSAKVAQVVDSSQIIISKVESWERLLTEGEVENVDLGDGKTAIGIDNAKTAKMKCPKGSEPKVSKVTDQKDGKEKTVGFCERD